MKIRKKNSIYVSRQCFDKKPVELLLIGKVKKKHYVLLKDIIRFMYYHSLHREKNIFAVIVSMVSLQKKY